jgi:uncharacterized phage protein gp47/JayE
MPNIPHRNPITVLRAIKDDIASSTGITNMDVDSKARVLTDVHIEELLDLRQDQLAADYSTQVSSARGKDLDALGESYGTPRRKATRAYCSKSQRNFMFYVDSGTFGDINGTASIVIPAGTLLYSLPNANELNTRIEFRTVGSHTLPAASALAFVTVEGLQIGGSNNIGGLVIRNHNFTSYVGSASQGLKVLNSYPVLNGRSEELDEVYRYRILQHYNRILQNSMARMQLLGLDVPGVLNIRVEPGYFGIGTAGVMVLGPEWTTTQSVIEGVQAKLNDSKTPGMDAVAMGAIEARFDFNIELKPTRTLSEQEQTRVKSDINRAMLQYFRKAGLGSLISLDDLLRDVQKQLTTTISFQDLVTDRVFKRVYVRRGFAASDTEERARISQPSYQMGIEEFASLGTLIFRFI